MKKITILILLVFSMASLFAQGFSFSATEEGFSMKVTGEENSAATTVKNSGEVIDKIVVKLEELQKKYNAKLNKLDGKRVNNIIDDIYSLLSLLPEDSSLVEPETSSNQQTETTSSTVNININGIETQSSQSELTPEVVATNSKKSMSDSDFSNLINRINGEGFSDDQLRVVRTAAKNHNFKVNQIIRILDCFSFSEEKISALAISYPGCLDPQNNYEILDAFTYSDDKSEAERIINAN